MAGPNTGELQKAFQLDATAAVDLNVYRFVMQVGESTVKQADTAGALCVGVAQTPVLLTERAKGNSGGKTTLVVMDGIPLVQLGTGGCTVGALIATDNVGKAVVATTGQTIMGVAQKAGAAGDFVPVQLAEPALSKA